MVAGREAVVLVKQLPLFTVLALAVGILVWNFSFYGEFYRARGDRMTVRAEEGLGGMQPLTPGSFEDPRLATSQHPDGQTLLSSDDAPGGAQASGQRADGSPDPDSAQLPLVDPGPVIEDVLYRYADGLTLRAQGQLRDGQRFGTWIQYWENKQVLNRGSYEDGERDGEWEFFYEDGVRRDQGSYDRGQRTGLWRTYHPRQRLMVEGHYQADERSGAWSTFYTDGSPKERGQYLQGVMQGRWEFYDPEGRLGPRSGLYRDGERVGD